MLLQLCTLTIAFVLTPFVVDRLGLVQYGLWGFLGSVVSAAGVLDLGLGATFVRFIARYHARGETTVVARFVSLGALAYLGLGVLLSPLALLFAPVIAHHLHLRPNLVATADHVFLLLFAYLFVSSSLAVLSALLTGTGDLWLASFAGLVGQVAYAIVVVGLLLNNRGLFALVDASFAQAVSTAVVCYVIARKRVGKVFGNPIHLGRSFFREVLSFGVWMQVNNVSALINLETDGIVIGAAVTVSDVGLYTIANRAALSTRILPLALLSALLPAASAAHAEGDDRLLRLLSLEGSRLLALVSLGLGGALVGLAPVLLRTWLGHSYPRLEVILALLVAAYLVNNLTGVGTMMVQATGRPRLESEYAVLSTVLNVVATVSLVGPLGLYGVVIGTVFGVIVSSAYFLWRFHHVSGIPLWSGLGSWLSRLLAAVGVSAAAIRCSIAALPTSLWSSRPRGALVLVVGGVLYCILLLAGLRLSGFGATINARTLGKLLPARVAVLLKSPIATLAGIRQ
jgi:O-antigen/teichoic acid export membrane protein